MGAYPVRLLPMERDSQQADPKPNHEAVAKVRREFTMMHINGSMAWVSFNQITPRTEDVLVNAGLSFQSRVLEKQNGLWKVRFAAHADTRMEYFHCPAICVGSDGTISWSKTMRAW